MPHQQIQQGRTGDSDVATSGTPRSAGNGRQKPAGLPFRRQKRGLLSNIIHTALKAFDLRALLPFLVILAGSLYVTFSGVNGFSAGMATLLTACFGSLSFLVVASRMNLLHRGKSSLQERFEILEDKAWELRESEERYRTLAEAFGDILVMRNREGRINYCNDAFAEILDTTRDELLGKGELPDQLTNQFSHAERVAGSREIVIENARGRFWYQWLDLDLRDDVDGGGGRLSVARDITAFKHSQQLDEDARRKAEEASNAKSRFLAMASHEMRTPLNGIIGMSKLLANTDLSLEQKNYNSALTSSGENLLGLIEGMLDLTMIEAGRFDLKREQFDFHSLMNNAIELLSSRAYAKNIDCGLYMDPSVPHLLTSDPGRLRQIVFNLAGNAIKFTAKGGVMIRCSLNDKIGQGRAVLKIDVVDSGPGMADVDRARIFLEFERVDDEITRKTDGAGLGLAISKALASQMGGGLELSRTGCDGSTFSLEIPVEHSNAEIQADVGTGIEDTLAKHSGDVLLVSKNVMEATCLLDTMRSRNISARWISSTDELAGLTNGSYAAILVDPENWKFSKSLTAGLKKALTQNGRMILITLPEKKSGLAQYAALGVNGWLVRPVRSRSLFQVLGENAAEPGDLLIPPDGSVDRKPVFKLETDPLNYCGHVLLAEDNDINALLVTAALSRYNIKVTRAENGKDALELFETAISNENQGRGRISRFDLVLMDMHMPVMGGLEAIEKMRRFERAQIPASKTATPIYALTADEQMQSESACRKAGADGFLVKPIDPQTLIEIVSRYLKDEDKKVSRR